MDNLQRANEFHVALLAMASHDLRQPLQSLIGAHDWLARRFDDALTEGVYANEPRGSSVSHGHLCAHLGSRAMSAIRPLRRLKRTYAGRKKSTRMKTASLWWRDFESHLPDLQLLSQL